MRNSLRARIAAVDLLLVLVVAFALVEGPRSGTLTGFAAGLLADLGADHELGRTALGEVLELAPDEPGFGAALAACQAGIAHHVEEEEGEVFPALRKQPALLAGMATPFMPRRLELGLPMGADALAAASTKDELLAEARSAHVEGASHMTKAELADALAATMS